MAYQETAYQSGPPEPGSKAFETAVLDELTLDATCVFGPAGSISSTVELLLSASAALDTGQPAAVILRFTVLLRRPGRFINFPVLNAGENDALAEPVIFFHKDAQVHLDFTLLNPDGTKFNLTGATVDLLVQPERGAALTFACSVIDAANGVARRTVAANDFAAGPYQAQLRVTNGTIVLHTVYFRILVGKAIE